MNTHPLVQWIDTVSGQVLAGTDFSASPRTGPVDTSLGVLFSATRTDLQSLGLRSASFGLPTPYLLANVRFYLNADPATLQTLLTEWPRESAGVSLSFDRGVTWTLFTTQAGNPSDPATWIRLPGKAVNTFQAEGQIGPNDTATLLLRVDAPRQPALGLLRFSLGVDADIW